MNNLKKNDILFIFKLKTKKNSIRHNLSLNKCFEKIENPTNGSKKGCLWALNPEKCKKLEEECKRCRQRDPVNIRLSMSRPGNLKQKQENIS